MNSDDPRLMLADSIEAAADMVRSTAGGMREAAGSMFEVGVHLATAAAYVKEAAARPIPMVLHCPKCRAQHIDKPEPERGWTNPPHKSHLCHECGLVWRPADVATVGVERVETRGGADTWPTISGGVA